MRTPDVIQSLRHGLIVSCHGGGDDPFGAPDLLLVMAAAAEAGGAAGLRVEGPETVRALRGRTRLPLIAFAMDRYEDGSDLITGSVEQIESLFEAGADIVAVDATKRKRPDGRDGFIFFEQVRRQVSRPLMADVSTFREGVRAAEIGADVVATTLAGYTPGTATQDYRTPDFELLEELALSLTIPVIAEGRIWTPDDAARCLARGAWAAVVGTAITRPRIITQMFVDALARQTEAGEI